MVNEMKCALNKINCIDKSDKAFFIVQCDKCNINLYDVL